MLKENLEDLRKEIDDIKEKYKGFEGKGAFEFLIEWKEEGYSKYQKGLEEYKGRVAFIHIRHKSEPFSEDGFTESSIYVGVDSGQAGFFDLEKFCITNGSEQHPKSKEFEEFYDLVGKYTLGKEQWGVIPYGIVSLSGYGDGGYSCYTKQNSEGKIVSAYIVFLSDYDEEEDEDVDSFDIK